MNLTEARTEFAARGFDYLAAGRMTIMLNDAKNQFEDSWPFPWLEATIIGPAPLTIPDLKIVRMVKQVDTDRELLGPDFRQVAQDDTDLDLLGVAEYWWAEGPDPVAILHTWPVDPRNIQAFYIRESPELEDPTDTPLIPARYHPVWIDLAVIQAYKDSDNFAAAGALRADVNLRMQSIIERYETRNRQHSIPMAVRSPSLDD